MVNNNGSLILPMRCACTHPAHMVVVEYRKEAHGLPAEISLSMQPDLVLGFWGRLKHLVRYLVGLRTNRNSWECCILTEADIMYLSELLWQYEHDKEMQRRAAPEDALGETDSED